MEVWHALSNVFGQIQIATNLMFQVIKQPINSKVLITPIILLLSILVGYITATQGLNYRLIMIFGALIIGAITLILGEKGIRIGFIGWLVMFSLGYRTLSFETTYLTGNSLSTLVKSRFQIHPLVVLIFLLWILIIIQSSGSVRFSSKSILPGILWIFCVFWVWGLILGGLKGIEIKDMLSDLLNFLIIIPVFVTSQFVLKKKQFWKFSLLIFYLTSTFIALMGAIEYLFPQVKTRFAGFFTSVNSVIDSVGFARAAFSFWGSPIAIFVIILSLPFYNCALEMV